MFAIETLSLSKKYASFGRKRVHALNNLELQVHRGEIFGFLGHNGAGKTTTIKLILGLIKPTSGEVKVLSQKPGAPELARKVGYLPETVRLYEYLSPVETLRFFARLNDIREAKLEEKIEEILSVVGLTHAANSPIREFSKGMHQRLGLAVNILKNPELFVLDEPTTGLDPLGRRMLKDVMLSAKNRGACVFFSSHQLLEVEQLCDRIAILHRGRLLEVFEVKKLVEKARKIELTLAGDHLALFERFPGATCSINREDNNNVTTVILLEDRTKLKEATAVASQNGAEIISIIPVAPSLEDYYLEKVRKEEEINESSVDSRSLSR